ncbi:MAG TPA: tail fiber domain-containing protein [Candidatus Binatia bacterium]|nr:tail fiber domain-containing protein [Candidatus Binatia bacterium]
MLLGSRRRVFTGLASLLLLVAMRGPAPAQLPAGNDTSDGQQNTGGGGHALAENGGGNNTAYGFDALSRNTTGANNSAVGASSLATNSTGENNTATGVNALFFNTTGNANTAHGVDALFNNDTGGHNTADGLNALFSNTTGSGNTAAGAGALQFNTTGSSNTACGGNALAFNTAGENNTASGANALRANGTGGGNTAVGVFALGASVAGSGNVAIGSGAGGSLTKGSRNVYVANAGEATESKTIRIGDVQKRTFIAGIAGRPVSGSTVVIDADGRLGVFASSARYKRDIRDMGDAGRGLLDLRPVTFRYKDDPSGERQYGLVAEEVARVYPELVVRSATGEVQSVKYEELIAMLLDQAQRQQREASELRAESAALRDRLDRLEAAVGAATVASR